MHGGTDGWLLAFAAVVIIALATALKYLIPARWMKEGGVPTIILVIGAIAGIVGFFVIPVVGLFIGFIVGVFLAEWLRVKSPKLAWPTTVTAMKASGLSVLIDLASVVLVTAAWIGVLVVGGQ